MNWVNGLYRCAHCGDEFAQGELTRVLGGIEFDVDQDGKTREIPYSVAICPDCYWRYVDEIARQILSY
jgi:DNA-directed RNA polymerase subunit RPC12/RpoP